MSEIPAPYGAQAELGYGVSWGSIWQRFLSSAECHTQAELAIFLGINPSSVASAKRRGSIPDHWLLTLLRKERINPDWILSGQGPRFLLPDYFNP